MVSDRCYDHYYRKKWCLIESARLRLEAQILDERKNLEMEMLAAQERRDEEIARLEEVESDKSSSRGDDKSMSYAEKVDSWNAGQDIDGNDTVKQLNKTDQLMDVDETILAPLAPNGPLELGSHARDDVRAHFPDPAEWPGFPCSRPDACEKPREQTNRLTSQIPAELASFFGSKDQCVPNSTKSQKLSKQY